MTDDKCEKFDDVWAMGRFKALYTRLNERQKEAFLAWIKARYFQAG